MYLIHTLHGTYGKACMRCACTHMWIMFNYIIQTLINYIIVTMYKRERQAIMYSHTILLSFLFLQWHKLLDTFSKGKPMCIETCTKLQKCRL